jgi:hypothetical protein
MFGDTEWMLLHTPSLSPAGEDLAIVRLACLSRVHDQQEFVALYLCLCLKALGRLESQKSTLIPSTCNTYNYIYIQQPEGKHHPTTILVAHFSTSLWGYNIKYSFFWAPKMNRSNTKSGFCWVAFT